MKHYPQIAGGAFDDPRADTVIADGLKYVAETRERFDAIIVDSSEPIGPSAVLHTREFFADCKRALKPGGMLVTQNGLPFLFPEHLRATTEIFAALFAVAAPYLCTQPCYFGGPFALNLATDDAALSGSTPRAWKSGAPSAASTASNTGRRQAMSARSPCRVTLLRRSLGWDPRPKASGKARKPAAKAGASRRR